MLFDTYVHIFTCGPSPPPHFQTAYVKYIEICVYNVYTYKFHSIPSIRMAYIIIIIHFYYYYYYIYICISGININSVNDYLFWRYYMLWCLQFFLFILHAPCHPRWWLFLLLLPRCVSFTSVFGKFTMNEDFLFHIYIIFRWQNEKKKFF